jgi:hypothetical protein
MFKFGSHTPTLFVQGTKDKVVMQLPFGEDNLERIEIMTQAGIQLGKSGQIGDVEMVVFVDEAWVSPARTPYVRPSEDPDRMEVLLITALDPQTSKQTVQMYSCVRDYKGTVIELKPSSTGAAEVESPLLPAFMTGFRLFKR